MRICKKCGIEKPSDATHFHRAKKGFKTICKVCIKGQYQSRKPISTPDIKTSVLSHDEIRKYRLELSRKQTELDHIHCVPCQIRKDRVTNANACHGCPIFEQLREIGEQMNALSRRKIRENGACLCD